jgi:hypothetical protein
LPTAPLTKDATFWFYFFFAFHIDKHTYIYIMHQPLLQLGLVQLQLGLILVAIYSRRVAIRSLVTIGSCPIATESDSL